MFSHALSAKLLKSLAKTLSLLTIATVASPGLTGRAVAQVVHDVRVEDHEFNPPIITIAPGDSVKWTAFGNDHTVTSDDPSSFDSTKSMPEPAIPLFGSFTVKFDAAGVYPYYCQVHGGPGGIGMAGQVRVIIPGANTKPNKPSNSAPANGATAVSITPTLTASAFADSDVDDVHVASKWVITRVSDSLVVADVIDSEQKTSFTPPALESGTAYSWTVAYRDAVGDWSDTSDATVFTTAEAITVTGSGLRGRYGKYDKKTGATAILSERLDPIIDFDWKLEKPAPKAPANYLYAVWEGDVVPPSSEDYLFRIVADGGVKLWINGQLIVDDWKAGKFPIYRGGIAELEAGVPASIKLEYYDTTGKASIKLRWISKTRPLEVIPTAVLYPASDND
jgi:plastocyanin